MDQSSFGIQLSNIKQLSFSDPYVKARVRSKDYVN